MKKTTLLLVLVFAGISVFAQDKAKGREKGKAKAELKSAGFQQIDAAQVPDAVKNSFTQSTPGVTGVTWQKHTAKGKADKSFTKYVAVYTVDGKTARARFREDGTAMSSSKYMGAQKLPENIRTTATTKNPGFELVGGEEVKTKKGQTFYRVRMKKGSSKLTTLYDANGNEVVKDKEPEEAKEDEGDEGN